jgi:hypothetical protein
MGRRGRRDPQARLGQMALLVLTAPKVRGTRLPRWVLPGLTAPLVRSGLAARTRSRRSAWSRSGMWCPDLAAVYRCVGPAPVDDAGAGYRAGAGHHGCRGDRRPSSQQQRDRARDDGRPRQAQPGSFHDPAPLQAGSYLTVGTGAVGALLAGRWLVCVRFVWLVAPAPGRYLCHGCRGRVRARHGGYHSFLPVLPWWRGRGRGLRSLAWGLGAGRRACCWTGERNSV